MYKIFIDTNILLDFYRINNQNSINQVLKEIEKYKKYFISTQQSRDEFFRNRERTIRDFIEELKKQNYKVHANNVIATLNTYEKYANTIAEANRVTRKIIEELNELVESQNLDMICEISSAINEVSYSRTENIIERAMRRKMIGNPPTSTKTTCCDEIIWETILENCKEDLIIVTRDLTFKENYNFLSSEFKEKNGKDLKIVETISKAIELNNELPSQELEFIESDIIIQDELENYGELQDNSNWVNIIYHAILGLGKEANLSDIYIKAKEIVNKKYPEKLENKDIEATIRGILQRYSSDSKHFNGKNDLFIQLKRGKWGIRKI